jgi:hypothetical protein
MKTHCKAVEVQQVPREMVLAAEEVPGEVQQCPVVQPVRAQHSS